MKERDLYGDAARRHIGFLADENDRLNAESQDALRQERKQLRKRRSFDALRRMSETVVAKVAELTADAEAVNVDGKPRKTVIAVLDEHDHTTITRNHTVVCGVSYLPDAPSAEFQFATVPTDFIGHLVLNPLILNDPDQLPAHTYVHEPEVTPSLYDFEYSLVLADTRSFPRSAIHKFREHRILEDRVSEAQRNLLMVVDASQDRVRNPHLPIVATN